MAATLSDVQGNYALFGDATPISLAGTNKRRISRTQQRVSYTGADILYRVKIKANASGDAATLVGTSGAVTLDTGTPDVERWTGQTGDTAAKDFEGVTILTAARIFGVLIEVGASNDKYIALSASQDFAPDIPQMQPGFTTCFLAPAAGYAGTLANLTFTFESHASAVDDELTITVCGKSS